MKIGWILSGDKNVAGARIQGWNIHNYLIKKGIFSEIIFAPIGFQTELKLSKQKINDVCKQKYSIIIFQKILSGKNFNYFINEAKKNGIKTAYLAVDRINSEFSEKCDASIAVSKNLFEQIKGKKYLVFDGFEHLGKKYRIHTNKKQIILVFVSNNVSSKMPEIDNLPENVCLKIIGPPKRRLEKYFFGKKIFTDTPYNFKYVEWSLRTIEREILSCDVGIIPYSKKQLNLNAIKNKSSNRLIMLMSYGLPTIASPHPEYSSLIKQGKIGFIARTKKEWTKYIKFLRDNPIERKRIGLEARKNIVKSFSIEQQGELYQKIFENILRK